MAGFQVSINGRFWVSPEDLVPRVAAGEPEGPRPGIVGPVPAPAQAQLLDDKLGERLGIALPLVHVCRGERDPVDVAPFQQRTGYSL